MRRAGWMEVWVGPKILDEQIDEAAYLGWSELALTMYHVDRPRCLSVIGKLDTWTSFCELFRNPV